MCHHMTGLCRAVKINNHTPQLFTWDSSAFKLCKIALAHFQFACLCLPNPLLKQQVHVNPFSLVTIRYRTSGLLSVAIKGHFCVPLNASRHTSMHVKRVMNCSETMSRLLSVPPQTENFSSTPRAVLNEQAQILRYLTLLSRGTNSYVTSRWVK